MTSLRTGLIVALLQVLLVGSVGAKFLIDRTQYPRVWMATRPFDPNLPIRGRYVSLSPVVKLEGETREAGAYGYKRVRRVVRDNTLVAIPDENGRQSVRSVTCGPEKCSVLAEPLAYFIPEHVADPSRHKSDEELWVEATIPPTGPPRPIRLGLKANGKMTILDVQ